MVEKHYRRTQVEALTGLSRSSIYDLMSRGEFPRPIKLTRRIVAWPESRIKAWLDQRTKESN